MYFFHFQNKTRELLKFNNTNEKGSVLFTVLSRVLYSNIFKFNKIIWLKNGEKNVTLKDESRQMKGIRRTMNFTNPWKCIILKL